MSTFMLDVLLDIVDWLKLSVRLEDTSGQLDLGFSSWLEGPAQKRLGPNHEFQKIGPLRALSQTHKNVKDDGQTTLTFSSSPQCNQRCFCQQHWLQMSKYSPKAFVSASNIVFLMRWRKLFALFLVGVKILLTNVLFWTIEPSDSPIHRWIDGQNINQWPIQTPNNPSARSAASTLAAWEVGSGKDRVSTTTKPVKSWVCRMRIRSKSPPSYCRLMLIQGHPESRAHPSMW